MSMTMVMIMIIKVQIQIMTIEMKIWKSQRNSGVRDDQGNLNLTLIFFHL